MGDETAAALYKLDYDPAGWLQTLLAVEPGRRKQNLQGERSTYGETYVDGLLQKRPPDSPQKILHGQPTHSDRL